MPDERDCRLIAALARRLKWLKAFLTMNPLDRAGLSPVAL
jgi:hypothetical protein